MGKHFEEKCRKNKKIKIKLILISLILLTIISTIAIYLVEKFENKDSKINNLINNAFIALKLTNLEEINKYMDYNKLVSSIDKMILEENDKSVSDLEKQLFSSIEWKINFINIEGNKVIANIEMKNKDFKEILTDWMKQIVNEKENNSSITPEIALEILENIVSENKSEKTVIKDIILEKQNDNFKIVIDDELRNLIFPGIESVATVINEK